MASYICLNENQKIIPETETERLERLESMVAAARLGGGDEPVPKNGKKESPAPLTLEETKKSGYSRAGH